MAKKSSRSAQRAQISAAQQRLAELRAQQQRSEARRRAILGTVVTVVVVLVIGAVGYIVLNHKDKADVTQATPESIADTSGIDGVKAWKTEASGQSGTEGAIQATHVGATSGSVRYFTYPPVGGPHIYQWLTCGEYPSTPQWEHAVHNMEHGAVIITYRPDLAADQKTALETLLKAQTTVVITDGTNSSDTKERYMDLWPYSGQKSPIVLSAWGRQLDVDTASDPRIQKFIDAFRAKSGFTPEYGSSCGPFTGAGGQYGTPEPGTT